ncbi:hypothetical protein NLY43_04305 [Mesorhizobium sp. C416B]|uniref:hypothetical protein n=1 Tax=unclassified Mesorhizobium TaxID=325217 RepID=UPI0003CE73E0|nr:MULTISPECIES: hypothetical protein [unclassified Mesorhizobium]ESX47736.1 hypothetical protein X762_17930 [Mesorhizobium sp. LSHC426A00]ESX51759.1 hypothetical protein X761_24385 [Mesorhizobium sp. LSHC424B00]ESX69929.1 hypothetical protein X758_19050 [Mesorhizobium sp. LSHC416B00]WJI63998.1 hypothetical protein NLY43_04305 [Mesorhizobium sp. C416B]
MNKSFHSIIVHPLTNTVVSVLVSAIVSYVTVQYTNDAGQDRNLKLTQISEFDKSSGDIISLSGNFIQSVNGKSDVNSSKTMLRSGLAKQIADTESLKAVFGRSIGEESEDYLDAIAMFDRAIDRYSGPTDIGPWINGFDKVLATKGVLSKQLYSQVGLKTES